LWMNWGGEGTTESGGPGHARQNQHSHKTVIIPGLTKRGTWKGGKGRGALVRTRRKAKGMGFLNKCRGGAFKRKPEVKGTHSRGSARGFRGGKKFRTPKVGQSESSKGGN